jgi:hypothetical protein
MRAKHSSIRSQLVYWVKTDLHNLYNLKIGDPTRVARQVAYLLEGDRYQCDPEGYEVCSGASCGGLAWSIKHATKSLTAPPPSFHGPANCHHNLWEIFCWDKNERDHECGI